jgi:hypothetical protein
VNESTPHHVEENFFPDDSGGEPPRWRRPFTWVTLVAIGWVLYELTARPALGSVAVCIKFGWEDFRTALWLRRRDPYPLRGRACFWLHLASGLFRIASVAGLMSIAFIALGHTFPARGLAAWRDLLRVLCWTALTTFAGMSCSALSIGCAAVLAWRAGIKLWLGNETHRARQRGVWPPYHSNHPMVNHYGSLLVIVFASMAIPLFLIVFIAFVLLVVNKNPNLLNGVLALLAFFLVVVGGPIVLLWSRDLFYNRLAAKQPGECWDCGDKSSPETESMAEMPINSVK